MKLSTRASLERAAPMAAGLVGGAVGFVVAPARADAGFFSTSAQVVPVLLLALVIEARVFGSPRRHRLGSRTADGVETARRVLEAVTVLVLVVAEARALLVIRNDFSSADPTLTYVGLAWGLFAIAAIAVVGAGKPRVTAAIEVVHRGKDEVIVRIGLSNEFGDRTARPLVNYLFSVEAEVWKTTPDGSERSDAQLWLTAPVVVRDKIVSCKFASARPELTPGDAELKHYAVRTTAAKTLVLVRADSPEFRRGRVECAAFVTTEGTRVVIDELTR